MSERPIKFGWRMLRWKMYIATASNSFRRGKLTERPLANRASDSTAGLEHKPCE